jgi:hypothetical protein
VFGREIFLGVDVTITGRPAGVGQGGLPNCLCANGLPRLLDRTLDVIITMFVNIVMQRYRTISTTGRSPL